MDTPDLDISLLDPESTAEMVRLINMDRFTTQAMGEPLAGLPDPSTFHTILDLACGPGGWVLDVAFAHPEIDVAGVDVSNLMIKYANARATSQKISNASFGVMDITQPLDFSDNTFDLVNARFLVGVLQREKWPDLIAECTRALRPGGILRLTEPVNLGFTTSPTLEEWNARMFQIIKRAGYGFSPTGRSYGMAPVLPQLLRKAGYQDVQNFVHVVEFSAGTPAWADFYRQTEIAYQSGKAMLVKAGMATQEEADQLYNQIIIELMAEDFGHMWHYQTVQGVKP
jgi:ubiquinone/menaquinone biosynthesis C-methylase UbiE